MHFALNASPGVPLALKSSVCRSGFDRATRLLAAFRARALRAQRARGRVRPRNVTAGAATVCGHDVKSTRKEGWARRARRTHAHVTQVADRAQRARTDGRDAEGVARGGSRSRRREAKQRGVLRV